MCEVNRVLVDFEGCSCGGNDAHQKMEKVERTFVGRRRGDGGCRVKYISFSVLVCFAVAVILSCTSPVQCAESESTLISQSEVKTIEPTNNPTKVFVRRRIFRKLVKDKEASSSASSGSSEEPTPSSTTTQSPSTSTRPRTLYSLVKRLDLSPSSTVTGNTLKSSISNSQSLASRQKFNFQSLKTRLGLAANGIVESSSTTSQPPSTTQNASLVMIPLPPSQRKPYTPVIMQVSKSTTSKPEATVQTFKLNKMFVPIGIYGKVVENGTEGEATTQATPTSSTPVTSIRHKGTDSGEKSGGKARKVKGIAESVDITYGRPNLDRVSLTTEKPDIGQISITTEINDLFSGGLFGSSNNHLRRGDHHYGGGNRRKQPFHGSSPAGSSGLTLMTPPKLGTPSGNDDSPSTLADSLGSYSSYASYQSPHKKFTPSSIVDSITDSMSRIPSLVPSLFHKGLTSLASMTSSLKENPFQDDNFDETVHKKQQKKPLVSAPSSYVPKIPASVPGGYINGMSGGSGVSGGSSRDQSYAASEIKSSGGGGVVKANVDLSEYETLEYFRKRPHLLAQLRKERMMEAAWRKSQGVRLSKGFKPVNAPDRIAREYYKSTSTTASTPEHILKMQQQAMRNGKKMRGSWLLRNSDEYVASKNDKLVRMWRKMLDSLTADDDEDDQSFPLDSQPSQVNPQKKTTRRVDNEEDHHQHNPNPQQQDPSSSSISARRSSVQTSPAALSAHWSSIKRKYSKSQLNEAKERILTLLDSGYGDEALHEIADEEDLQHYSEHDTSSHMPPPPPPHRVSALSLTKGLSGAAAGAFKDLVKMFKFGVSVGTGHSREPVNYEQVVDEQEAEEVGGHGGDWKPVRRPLISFSAGISLKNPLSSKPHHNHHHVHEDYEEDTPLTHYSSSSKPYIPTAYKGLNGYIDELATTSQLKPTPYSYPAAEDDIVTAPDGPPSQSIDYTDDGDSLGYASATSTSYAASTPASKYYDSVPQYSYDRYSTLRNGKRPSLSSGLSSSGLSAASISSGADMQHGAESTWQPLVAGGVNPNEYELVPSSVYLNGQHDPRDIAAVVKPAGVSDDLVRSALPAGLRNLRILDYPNVYGGGVAGGVGYNSLNSISQVLGKERGVKPTGETFTSFKHAMKKLRENYVAKENAYLPQEEIEDVDEVVYGGQQQQQVGSSVRGAYATGGSGGSVYSVGGLSGLSGLGATYYTPIQHSSGLVGALSGLENGNVFATADRINNLARGASAGAYGGGLSNVYAQQLQQQQVQQQYVRGGSQGQVQAAAQKDPLGFTTNYNLPSNLDPDIAALLKSELDKDDIPEDVRQEFLEAKEQEKKEKAQKQQQQQQQAYQQQQQSNRRVDNSVDIAQQTLIDSLLSSASKSNVQRVQSQGHKQQLHAYRSNAMPSAVPLQNYAPAQPTAQSRQHHGHGHQYYAPQQQQRQVPTHPTPSLPYRQLPPQSRAYQLGAPPAPAPSVVATRFFAPIPITPTLMTTALKNPRYSSPVPRYVIELAKKLQGDKTVQGIVRVSAKRGRGLPPIEYLYPVKG